MVPAAWQFLLVGVCVSCFDVVGAIIGVGIGEGAGTGVGTRVGGHVDDDGRNSVGVHIGTCVGRTVCSCHGGHETENSTVVFSGALFRGAVSF